MTGVILRIILRGFLNAILRIASRNPPSARLEPVRQTLVERPRLECPTITVSQWHTGQEDSRTEKRTGWVGTGRYPDLSAGRFGPDEGRAN